MAAVLTGGLIVIWLALSGGRAVLANLGVHLHRPAALVAPLLLALVETPVFLLAVPAGGLMPDEQGHLAALILTVLAWLASLAVAGRVLQQHWRAGRGGRAGYR